MTNKSITNLYRQFGGIFINQISGRAYNMPTFVIVIHVNGAAIYENIFAAANTFIITRLLCFTHNDKRRWFYINDGEKSRIMLVILSVL